MRTPANWAEALARERREKDHYFGSHPQSPLPPDHREGFDGLVYYPPDPDYRFELTFHDHDTPQTVTVATTTDGEQDYLEAGEFRFAVGGRDVRLQGYRRPAGDDGLWLPFRDETNATATYGAGRYVDLDPETDRLADGRWVVDFNRAYNPFCAYSDAYECPLVPMENWLEVSIEAGEKRYEPQGGHGAGGARGHGHRHDHSHDHA